MSDLVLNYAFNSPQFANPDGTLPVIATGCSIVAGPGSTTLGTFPHALDFGSRGKAQVNLPLDRLNTRKFCVRVLVKVNAAVTVRQNLVESNAVPFSLFLDPIAGSPDPNTPFRAAASVAPNNYGWSGTWAAPLKAGNWYLIDLLYDNDTLGIAIDGNLASVHAFPGGTINLGANPALYIGTWGDGSRYQFRGAMAALQIHDGIPTELEALLDERRNSPEWFISSKYEQLKSTLNLGSPIGGIVYDAAATAYRQTYSAGLIMYSEAIGAAFEMHGAIYDLYKTLPNKSDLGYLVSDEMPAAIGGARKNLFSKGGIYWSGGTGTVAVTGQIYVDYEMMGEAAWIGLPVSASTAISGGREQIFSGARMYHKTGQPKAHEVHGAILSKFLDTGSVAMWGYPISNETEVKKDGVVIGRSSEFENCAIYWNSATGAHEVHGDIRRKYRDLNGPLGSLGFPTSDELNIPGAPAPACCNSFQNGSILWFGSFCNMYVCYPYTIFITRIDSQEDEGAGHGQNDLYFWVTLDENGHQILNRRYPSSGYSWLDRNLQEVNEQLPIAIAANNIDSAITITFDIWESDKGALFGGPDDRLGTYSHTLNAANAWGMAENNGLMNTGGFSKINSVIWSVKPVGDEVLLTETQKWWGVQNRPSPELSYETYAAAFRDVDSDPEWWDITDWLEKAFYELVIKDIAKGNCFGMSLEAIYARKHRSRLGLPLDRFTNWSEVEPDFNVKQQYQVGASAIWWMVGQFLSGNTRDPVDVFQTSREEWNRGNDPVLGMCQNWDFSGAPHALLPIGWDDSTSPWKIRILDPNFPGEVREIQVFPDDNRFIYDGGLEANGEHRIYSGAEWSGGRMYYRPYSILDEPPRTPIWDAILLILTGVIIICGEDAETTSLTDENGVDLDAFGADAIARLKAKRPLDNKFFSFKGVGGNRAIASEMYLRAGKNSEFTETRTGAGETRLGANMTFGELAQSGTLPVPLRPLVLGDPRRFAALAGRDIKSIVSDEQAVAGLDPAIVKAFNGLAKLRSAGKNVIHNIRGKKAGHLNYVIKQPLSVMRLTTPIATGESHTVALRDLGTPSGVIEFKSPVSKRANLTIDSKLGAGKDAVLVQIDNLPVDAGKALQVNVKPGLGGVEILGTAGGGHADVSIRIAMGDKVQRYNYTIPVDGGVRLRPSTVLGSHELKIGRIDTLFGQLRTSSMLKPR